MMFLRRALPLFALLATVAFAASNAVAGPFDASTVPGYVPDPANPAVDILNPELRAWAIEAINFAPSPGVNTANGNAAKAFGPIGSTPDGNTVSLGDLTATEISDGLAPGQITLRMSAPLRNGAGWDLAVFENAFAFFPPDDDKVFAELAYVEVSTDGVTFARFPAESLTTTLFEPFGPSFAGIDPTDVHNLAGASRSLQGTPFDFAELSGVAEVVSGAVQVDDINYVRLVDIPGDGSWLDSQGRGIREAWPTTDLTFGNGGLDLDAVAGRYPVPEPSTVALAAIAGVVLIAKRFRKRIS
jgi:hypothetical protein